MDNFDLRKYLAEGRLFEEDPSLNLDAALKKGLSSLESNLSIIEGEDLSQTIEEDQLNESIEGLVISGLLAAPKLIQWMGKAVGWISKFFTGKDENKIADEIEEIGEKWEKFYVKTIAKAIKLTGFLKQRWYKDGKQDNEELYILSKTIYGVILALALSSATLSALSAFSPVIQAIEGILGGIKGVEILGIVKKIKHVITTS